MIYVQCPASVGTEDTFKRRIFIAGGISGCPDWQSELEKRIRTELKFNDDVVLVNPRRNDMTEFTAEENRDQIDWESQQLACADVIWFWFPWYTLCPITLFELGKSLNSSAKLIVGCHPAYQRARDVQHQLLLSRPDVIVHDNWAPMIDELNKWYEDEQTLTIS